MAKHNRNKSNSPVVKYELPEQQMKIEKFIDENGFPPEGEVKSDVPPVEEQLEVGNDITVVGNTKVWDKPVDYTIPSNEELSKGKDIIPSADTLPSIYKSMIQEVNVSADLSRTELNELGHVAPYQKYVDFPVNPITPIAADGLPGIATDFKFPPELNYTFPPVGEGDATESIIFTGSPNIWKKVDGPSEEQKKELEESPDSLGAVGSSQPVEPIVITLPEPAALVYKPGDSEVVKAVESQPVKNNGMATSPPGSTGPKKGYLRHTAPAKREK